MKIFHRSEVSFWVGPASSFGTVSFVARACFANCEYRERRNCWIFKRGGKGTRGEDLDRLSFRFDVELSDES